MKVALVGIPVQDPIEAHEIYTNEVGIHVKEVQQRWVRKFIDDPGPGRLTGR